MWAFMQYVSCVTHCFCTRLVTLPLCWSRRACILEYCFVIRAYRIPWHDFTSRFGSYWRRQNLGSFPLCMLPRVNYHVTLGGKMITVYRSQDATLYWFYSLRKKLNEIESCTRKKRNKNNKNVLKFKDEPSTVFPDRVVVRFKTVSTSRVSTPLSHFSSALSKPMPAFTTVVCSCSLELPGIVFTFLIVWKPVFV